MDKAEHPVRRANRVESSRVLGRCSWTSAPSVDRDTIDLSTTRYTAYDWHARSVTTCMYASSWTSFFPPFFLLSLLSPPPLLLLLLLLPSSHAVILVSEFLPRGADKKSDRKGASKGCDKAWGRGQIGRDTRRREGAQCLECRVKSMEKINTDTTFVALDKTFLKQGDRCDENATTAEGRLPDSFKLTSQLECWLAFVRGRSVSIDQQARICLYFRFFLDFLFFPDISMKRVWIDWKFISYMYIYITWSVNNLPLILEKVS